MEFLEVTSGHAVYINVNPETMMERMRERKLANEIQRSDDTEQILQKRIKVFENDTLPIIEKFRGCGSLLELDGEKSPDRIILEYLSKTSSQ